MSAKFSPSFFKMRGASMALLFTMLLFRFFAIIDGGITEEDVGTISCCYRSFFKPGEERDTHIFVVFQDGNYYKVNINYLVKWNLVFFSFIIIFGIIILAYKKQRRTLVDTEVLPINEYSRRKETEFSEGLLATSPDNIIL